MFLILEKQTMSNSLTGLYFASLLCVFRYGTPVSSELGVGSESSNYIHLFMAYDNESSQAANHALALIGSSDSLFKTQSPQESEKSQEEIDQR